MADHPEDHEGHEVPDESAFRQSRQRSTAAKTDALSEAASTGVTATLAVAELGAQSDVGVSLRRAASNAAVGEDGEGGVAGALGGAGDALSGSASRAADGAGVLASALREQAAELPVDGALAAGHDAAAGALAAGAAGLSVGVGAAVAFAPGAASAVGEYGGHAASAVGEYGGHVASVAASYGVDAASTAASYGGHAASVAASYGADAASTAASYGSAALAYGGAAAAGASAAVAGAVGSPDAIFQHLSSVRTTAATNLASISASVVSAVPAAVSGIAVPAAVASAASAVAAGIGTAGDAVADAAAAAAPSVGAAFASAAAAGQTAASAVGSALQPAGAFLASAGQTIAASGAGAWVSGAATAAYSLGRDQLASALAAAAGVAVSLWDLVKIEIIRDVYQTLALFFANLASGAMEQAKVVWGNISGVVSFNFDFVIPSISPVVIYAILGVIAGLLLFAFVWMVFIARDLQPDEVRMGHENKSWAQRADENKTRVKAVRIILTVALSAYLPVSRSIVQILWCDGTMGRVLEKLGADLGCIEEGSGALQRFTCDCGRWDGYQGLLAAAWILLILFTIFLPLFCFWLIRKSIPVGSREDPTKRYDEDGNHVEYTDAMYQHDLLHDPRQVFCPYLFLYEGFERKWAYYKVIVMMFKLILILPVILLWDRPLIQTIVTLCLLFVFSVFSFLSSPFISPQADVMDASGRVTAFLTVLFALVATDSVVPSSEDTMGILINVANAVNLFVLIVFFLYSLPAVRLVLQNLTGRLIFSDTTKDITGSAHRIVGDWDVLKELKHRIWHPFWQSLLLNKELFGEDVPRRLADQLRLTAEVGKGRMVHHFQALSVPNMNNLFLWVQENLEGQDVYWDGVSFDGKLDSKTNFGKMYVQPFPFCCVMVYDDGGDHTFIYGGSNEFHEFVAKNQEPEVQRRRGVRRMIRALDSQRTYYTFQKQVRKTVADGTTTDSKGNKKTRYSTITVTLTFHSGILSVRHNTSNRMADGFRVSVRFDDGAGSGTAPHTGKVHHFSNEVHIMDADELGVNSTFTPQGPLKTIFDDPRNARIVTERLPQVEAAAREYRHELLTKRAADEAALSSAFWLHVFDAFALPRPTVEWYLRFVEQNPKLRTIPDDHRAGLDFLYARLAMTLRHPAAAFWFIFFEDVWSQNKEMKAFKEHKALFDPQLPTALCYTPMPRADLIAKLDAAGLHKKRSLFSDDLIDLLYTEIDKRSAILSPLQRAGTVSPRGSIVAATHSV